MNSKDKDNSRSASTEEINNALKMLTDLVEKLVADPALSEEIKAPLREQLQNSKLSKSNSNLS